MQFNRCCILTLSPIYRRVCCTERMFISKIRNAKISAFKTSPPPCHAKCRIVSAPSRISETYFHQGTLEFKNFQTVSPECSVWLAILIWWIYREETRCGKSVWKSSQGFYFHKKNFLTFSTLRQILLFQTNFHVYALSSHSTNEQEFKIFKSPNSRKQFIDANDTWRNSYAQVTIEIRLNDWCMTFVHLL